MEKYDFPNFLIFFSIAAYIFSILLQVIGYVIFRRHAASFERLLSEFRKRKLQLDISTDVSSFFSASFHPLKIAYFARLYKGVTLHHKKNERVNTETYEFIQSLPKKDIYWLVRLHNFNLITAFLMLGGSLGVFVWQHYFNS